MNKKYLLLLFLLIVPLLTSCGKKEKYSLSCVMDIGGFSTTYKFVFENGRISKVRQEDYRNFQENELLKFTCDTTIKECVETQRQAIQELCDNGDLLDCSIKTTDESVSFTNYLNQESIDEMIKGAGGVTKKQIKAYLEAEGFECE